MTCDHADADLGIAGRAGHEIRDRDRERSELAFGNDDAFLGEGIANAAAASTAPVAAIPEMICRRLGRNNIFGNPSLSVMASILLMCDRQRLRTPIGARGQTFSLNTGAKYFHSS